MWLTWIARLRRGRGEGGEEGWGDLPWLVATRYSKKGLRPWKAKEERKWRKWKGSSSPRYRLPWTSALTFFPQGLPAYSTWGERWQNRWEKEKQAKCILYKEAQVCQHCESFLVKFLNKTGWYQLCNESNYFWPTPLSSAVDIFCTERNSVLTTSSLLSKSQWDEHARLLLVWVLSL